VPGLHRIASSIPIHVTARFRPQRYVGEEHSRSFRDDGWFEPTVSEMTTQRNVPSISIICPVRNEAPLIPALIEALSLAHAAGAEIVVVDDASTDGTGALLDAAGFINVVHQRRSNGFGAAVKAGMGAATGDIVAWMPGNMRVRPMDTLRIARTIAAVSQGRSLFAKASRTGRPFSERASRFIAGLTLSIWSRRDLMDTGATPTVVPRSALKHLVNGPDDITFECYTLWKLPQSGFEVIRPEVPYVNRPAGTSHWNTGARARFKLFVKLLRSVRTFR